MIPAFLPALLSVIQLDIGRDVSVRFLCFPDDLNPSIQQGVQRLVFRHGVHIGKGLKKFVAIPIAPICSPMSALLEPRGDTEIIEIRGVLGILQSLLHGRNHGCPAARKALRPESIGPLDGVDVYTPELDVRAGRCIRNPPAAAVNMPREQQHGCHNGWNRLPNY